LAVAVAGCCARHVDREVLDADLGQYWHLTSGGLRVKTRPVMAMAQPTTWAMYDLLSKHEFALEDVKSVRVESSKRIRLGDIRPPTSTVAARMSIPFLVAAALVHREDYLADPYLTKFITPELLNDSRVAELSDQVELVANDEFDFNLEHATPSTDSNHYMKFEARVTVTLNDGRQLVQYKDVFAEGTGAMSRERLENKFRALTEGKLSEKQASKIVAAVWHLEDLRDVGDLARMTSEGTGPQADAR
jgi:2-methylcitrate dehydratase PrpD